MNQTYPMTEFELLALESSSERRRELLRGLTDMFLDGIDRHTDEGTALFAEIACRVLDEVTEDVRRELAERVAPLVQFPPDIIRKLAEDVIAVALPVLERSPALREQDLIGLARCKGQEHLLAISRRDDLREPVTDILVERGEARVLHSVTGNAAARLSPEGFRALAEKSIDDRALQERLVGRADMPASVAGRLERLLDGELRQMLATVRAINMEQDFANHVANAAQRLEKAIKGSRRERIEIQALITQVRSGARPLNSAITQLARDNRPVHLGWLLAAMTDLPEAIVSNTLNKINGLPIAVTCKALGVAVETFHAVALMRCRRLKLPVADADRLSEQYRGLHLAEAQRTLRFLKVRHGIPAPAARVAQAR